MQRTESVKNRLETVIALARLLERVNRDPARVGALQYQALVRRVQGLLAEGGLPDDVMQAVLAAHPVTAELYENLNYAHAGLSRSPLDRSVASEMATSALLARIAKGAASSLS